ncbi:hypothetical protein EFA46_011600 (plasmid) [Halarchaeum sp. CBA1220]|uniref:hypothetical protein n=1 Tax=Halarchaeum sp. CBA1220 TaxID=1853682 RepID=UPI0011CEB4E6|nr:hypothetical protein [Halarchaeum sp. CBA1220]QLC34898.1 hypothetical protein EFA46_011600 [Halarchaeum sp. CBA1220]
MSRPPDAGLSESHRLRAGALLALGFVLVFGPALAGPIGTLPGPDDAYTYEAVEVTAENETLVFHGPLPDDGVRGVDCLRVYSRLCGLEVDQLDGNVTVRQVNPVERRASPYVEFFDQYYRRIHVENGRTVTYGLRPVSPRTVLDDVSRPVGETGHPDDLRRVISRGTATIDHRIASPTRVVRSDGSYYVFNLQRAETPHDRGPSLAPLGTVVAMLAGLWSLRRGWVHYDRWRASR